MKIIYVAFVLASFSSIADALKTLFTLPCYGGHFGSMVPVILSLSDSHDVTVIETSNLCRQKLAPFKNLASFKTIEEDIAHGDLKFENFVDTLTFLLNDVFSVFDTQFNFLKDYLITNRKLYDVMITDSTLEGSLLAAEVAEMPVAVILPSFAGASEFVADKMGATIAHVLINQIMAGPYWNHLYSTRSKHQLPEIVQQNNFYAPEYSLRFPSLIGGSPLVYPEPDPSISYIYIGGARNENHYETLPESLDYWLNSSEKPVIYISLGTILKLNDDALLEFAGKVRKQEDYRFVWSMGSAMKDAATSLNISTDAILYVSGYIPQYTLLGHGKVQLFVTHAGFGSLTDVIKRRKPAVCAPQLFDQPYNCKKMESLGTAEQILSFGFDDMLEAIKLIFANYDTYVANTVVLASNFKKYEQKESIEEFLQKVASKGRADIIEDFGFDLSSQRLATAWVVFKLSGIVGAILLLFLTVLLYTKVHRYCSKNKQKVKRKEN